jgi:hypothetical protein
VRTSIEVFFIDASEEVNAADLLMLVLNLFFCFFKETVAEFYYQVQIRWGKGFKMLKTVESIVQDCDEAEFSVMPRSAIEIYKNHKVYTLNHIIKKNK